MQFSWKLKPILLHKIYQFLKQNFFDPIFAFIISWTFCFVALFMDENSHLNPHYQRFSKCPPTGYITHNQIPTEGFNTTTSSSLGPPSLHHNSSLKRGPFFTFCDLNLCIWALPPSTTNTSLNRSPFITWFGTWICPHFFWNLDLWCDPKTKKCQPLIGYKSRSQKKSLPRFFWELDWASLLLGFHFISLIPKEVSSLLPSTTNPNLKKNEDQSNSFFWDLGCNGGPKKKCKPSWEHTLSLRSLHHKSRSQEKSLLSTNFETWIYPHFLQYRFRSQNKWRTNSSLKIHTKKEGTSFETWMFSSLPAP